MRTTLNTLLVMGLVSVAAYNTTWAASVFSEDFNSPTGQNQNANQATTGFPVAFGGDIANWAEAGAGTAHLVDRGGSDSWALMLYQGPGLNILTSNSIAGGNFAGRPYSISFDLGPAVYNNILQATDDGVAAFTDGVYVEVLDSTDAVMAIQLFKPGSFASQASAGSLPLLPVTMNYLGSGVGAGDVKLRLSANNADSGRFGGTVDNLNLESTALFFEDFNQPTGNFNNTQYITGLPVGFGGDFAHWTELGAGTTHLVERTTGDRAAMFYNGAVPGDMNQIQSVAIPGGNILGQPYELSFELAPGSYDNGSQASTATDGMVVQLVDSNNLVVATNSYLPGEFSLSATLGDLAFAPIVFNYLGTGSGDGSIAIRFLPNFAGSNKFGGSIDNVQLLPVPEPSSIALGLIGAFALIRFLQRRK